MERYRAAKYVADHRQEIQAALDYVARTPTQAGSRTTIDRSSETLQTSRRRREVTAAKEAIDDIDGLSPFDGFDQTQEAFGHVRNGVGGEARPRAPSATSPTAAEQVSPYVDQVEVLVPVYYGGLFDAVDNFARDEIVGTLCVMAAAFGLAFVLGRRSDSGSGEAGRD